MVYLVINIKTSSIHKVVYVLDVMRYLCLVSLRTSTMIIRVLGLKATFAEFCVRIAIVR